MPSKGTFTPIITYGWDAAPCKLLGDEDLRVTAIIGDTIYTRLETRTSDKTCSPHSIIPFSTAVFEKMMTENEKRATEEAKEEQEAKEKTNFIQNMINLRAVETYEGFALDQIINATDVNPVHDIDGTEFTKALTIVALPSKNGSILVIQTALNSNNADNVSYIPSENLKKWKQAQDKLVQTSKIITDVFNGTGRYTTPELKKDDTINLTVTENIKEQIERTYYQTSIEDESIVKYVINGIEIKNPSAKIDELLQALGTPSSSDFEEQKIAKVMGFSPDGKTSVMAVFNVGARSALGYYTQPTQKIVDIRSDQIKALKKAKGYIESGIAPK
jgi:hypothetical protein